MVNNPSQSRYMLYIGLKNSSGDPCRQVTSLQPSNLAEQCTENNLLPNTHPCLHQQAQALTRLGLDIHQFLDTTMTMSKNLKKEKKKTTHTKPCTLTAICFIFRRAHWPKFVWCQAGAAGTLWLLFCSLGWKHCFGTSVACRYEFDLIKIRGPRHHC